MANGGEMAERIDFAFIIGLVFFLSPNWTTKAVKWTNS
jgi:hypothetical protein